MVAQSSYCGTYRICHMAAGVLPGIQTLWWLSSYVNNCHIHHAHIHNSFNHSLPLTVCMALTFFLCRKSAPKVSHSSCTRSLCPQRDASRTAVQPSWGKGSTVDCEPTEGVWVECGTQYLECQEILPNLSIWHWQSTAFVWVFPLTGEVIQIFTIPTFTIFPSLVVHEANSQTHHLLLLKHTHHLLPGDVNEQCTIILQGNTQS